MFDSDKYLAPAVVFLTSPIFGYFAYREDGWSKVQVMYMTAAALLFSTVPYSYLLLEPIGHKLDSKASSLASASLTDAGAEAGVAKEETVHSLVDRWATVNLGRTVLTGLASILATWAALDRLDIVPAVAKLATGANRMGH